MAAKRLFASPIFRFSIRQLLVATALVAVACVALRSASPIWVAALLGLTLLMLTAALPLAICRQGADRAWWSGFALFGWMYLLLLAYSWSLDINTSQGNPLRPYSLVTTRLSNLGHDKVYGGAQQILAYQQLATTSYVAATNGYSSLGNNPYSSAGSASIPSTSFIPVNSYSTVAIPTLNGGPTLDDFVNVAHAFWALLIAICGGWFTCWIYKGSARQPETKTDLATAPTNP